MQLKNELEKAQHKHDWLRLSAWIGNDPHRFEQLMEHFFSGHMRVNQRAAAVVMHCFDHNPNLIIPHLKRLVENLDGSNHDAIVRNTFRILQFVKIPDDLKGLVLDKALLYFNDEQQAIAIRVFAMTVAYNCSIEYPELQLELAAMIEEKMPYGSAGFRNRGGKLLAKIQRNTKKHR